jgi:hypothetical protein
MDANNEQDSKNSFSKKMKKQGIFIGLFLLALIEFYLIVIFFCPKCETTDKSSEEEAYTSNGMILLIENDLEKDGIEIWEKELDSRGLTAIVKPSKDVLYEFPETFKRLSDKGYEIAVGYGEAPCWDMSYEEQYEHMKEAVESSEEVMGKKPRIYSCQYFSYDENTMKAADELGVEYLLARGTQDVRSVVYKANEYNVKLISVSNIEFSDMGKGSLCDISLYARGATAEEFGEVVEQSFNEMNDNIMLVSHAHLGGTRADWWNVYKDALNTEKVTWRTFDDWIENLNLLEMPNADIPVNTEVKYMTPTPATPIEDLELVPELQGQDAENDYVGEKLVMYHNGTGPMCLDALEFLETIDYTVEQHLTDEEDFQENLSALEEVYGSSEGVSTSFGYYPIIFIQDRAFSGFNDEVKQKIESMI